MMDIRGNKLAMDHMVRNRKPLQAGGRHCNYENFADTEVNGVILLGFHLPNSSLC